MRTRFGQVVCGVAWLVLVAGSGASDAQVGEVRASEAIEMVAELDLSLNEPVTPSDYRMAMELLGMALELDPDNADLARSLAESAWMAGDHDTLISATRVVVKNDPQDTVAQLRLISSIVNREQTVEGRIAAYQRFVGDKAQTLDVSVRSRLMLDMALLERERGNETGYLTTLRQAAKLDPANKEAQSLVAQHYSRIIDEPSTLMRLQMRVLYADPLDPNVHISIARMCAAEGASDVAWRFLNNGIAIFKIDTGKVPALLQEQQLSLLWQYEGPQEILDRLNPSLKDERETMQARIDARLEANEPIDDLQQPYEIRYEAGIDRIRLLAAYIVKDQETVDSVLLDLRRGLAAYYEATREQMMKRGADQRSLTLAFLAEVVTFQTMRAIVGVDSAIIKSDMDNIIEKTPQLKPYFRPFEPFSLYASGEYEKAKESAMEKLAPSAPRDLLIALISEKTGQREESVELYTQLALHYPLEATGALARSRLAELTDGADQRTPEGAVMSEIAARVPDWIEKMIYRPQNTMSLSVSPTQSSYAPGEKAGLRIRLANLTPMALSLGSSHPIDSNLLIVPGFREIDGEFLGAGRAKVVDLGRRLRLEPSEEMVVVVDPDSVQTRWLIDTQPQSVIRQRWRALQGFKPLPTGGIVNSPFALVSESPLIEREVLPEAGFGVDRLIDSIGSKETGRFERGVMGAVAVLYNPSRRPDLTEEDLGKIVEALWAAYNGADTTTRVWMLGVLPTGVASKAMKPFDERAQQTLVSDSLIDPAIDPVLVAMVLMTRVESMGSPVFEVARAHADPRLGWMAGLLSERIRNVEAMYTGTDTPFQTFAPSLTDRPGL